MHITRIDIEGSTAGRYPSITRRKDSEHIEVTIITPQTSKGMVKRIHAKSFENVLWNFARELQTMLDGRLGTNGDIDDYYRVLQRFAD